MRFGALLPTRPAYLSRAPELEVVGYQELWFPDFQLVGADPFVTMATVGKEVATAHLGVAVCNPVTRHATVVANCMASLNRLYPGRVGLGVGAGASPLSALGLRSATIGEVRRFVEGCRALLDGRPAPIGAQGKEVGFLDVSAPALDTTDRVPIRLAAGGPRSLRLAGAVSDEVILGTIEPVLVDAAVALVREGASEAGRDPSSVGVAVLAAAYAGDDDSLAKVVAHVGGYVPNMFVSNRALALRPETGLDGPLREAFVLADAILSGASTTSTSAGSRYERYMETVPEIYRPLVTPEAVAAKVFTGGPAAFAERCAELERLGVGKVVLFPDPADDGAIARIGREWIGPLHAADAR